MKKVLIGILFIVVTVFVYLYNLAKGYRETTFCIIVTSDLGKWYDLMPRAATAIAEALQSCEGRAVVIDNGGLLSFSTSEAVVRASMGSDAPESRYLAAVGYQFLNVTPDLFWLGAAAFKKFLHDAGVSVITQNLHGEGGKRMVIGEVSLAVYGLVVAESPSFMPASLFEEVSYLDPFEGGGAAREEAPADFNILVISADNGMLSGRRHAEPADILFAIHTHFPHLALVVSNDPFPPSLVAESGGSTLFASLNPSRPELFFAKTRMIRHRDDTRAIIVSLDTTRVAFDAVPPDPSLSDLFASFQRGVREQTSLPAGVPWYPLDLRVSRRGDTPAGRLLHETLISIASRAGVRADMSAAFIPQRPFVHEAGTAFPLSSLDLFVPEDCYPLVVTMSGERLIDFLEKAWGHYPDAAVSLFPLSYTVSGEGRVSVRDSRFSLEKSYVLVVDGQIREMLFSGEEEAHTTPVTVLSERPGEYLARHFPSRLAHIFAPLWMSE